MFIPRNQPPTQPSSIPVYVPIIIAAFLLALLMFIFFLWRIRRAAHSDALVLEHATEKKLPPHTAHRPPVLPQLPRAYTPFSSLPPRWSPRQASEMPPARYSTADEMATIPLYSPAPAPAPARPAMPRRYSSRRARLGGLGGGVGMAGVGGGKGMGTGLERLDEEKSGQVMGKLNSLIAKIR